MPTFDFVVESPCSDTIRARQLESMFDVPRQEMARIEYRGDMPLDAEPWNVGLIVGPSGSGKTTILRKLFGEAPALEWKGASVIDDFSSALSIDSIAAVCQAVGFNTIPAWLRPYAVLSNGEQFRVDLARRLLETEGVIAVDEFTSVVDRQVAKIGAFAVQKHVRKEGRQFVGASCHYDIIEWLQPDWTFEPATMTFSRRSLRGRRPELRCTVGRIPRTAWQLFANYHYLTAKLPSSVRTWGAWVEGNLAAFLAMIHEPSPFYSKTWRGSRVVTLPDYQGLGVAFQLVETVASAMCASGLRVRVPPAHPSFVRSFARSDRWVLKRPPGKFVHANDGGWRDYRKTRPQPRPCAIFEWCGAPMWNKGLAQYLSYESDTAIEPAIARAL